MEKVNRTLEMAWQFAVSMFESLYILLANLITIETLTLLLVVITGFYAWTTFRMLQANRRILEVMELQTEHLTRPQIDIQIKIRPNTPLIILKIVNKGNTAALDLKLKVDRDFYQLNQRNIRDFNVFKEPIKSLPSQSTIEIILIEGHALYESNDDERLPKSFAISAEYSYAGKTIEEIHPIDLTPYNITSIFEDDKVRALKQINTTLSKIANHRPLR